MTWYRAPFGTADNFDYNSSARIGNEYEQILISNGFPKEAALFASDNLGGGADEFHYVYFSPGAARIAGALLSKLGAAPCDKPSANTVGLLVGHDSDRELLEDQFEEEEAE
jgi:hypothetical protein